MANIWADDVCDANTVPPSKVPNSKVLKLIKCAGVTFGLEVGRDTHFSNGSSGEKEFIIVLFIIYAICDLPSGSAVGLSFTVEEQKVSILNNAPFLGTLQAEFDLEFAVIPNEEKRALGSTECGYD